MAIYWFKILLKVLTFECSVPHVMCYLITIFLAVATLLGLVQCNSIEQQSIMEALHEHIDLYRGQRANYSH